VSTEDIEIPESVQRGLQNHAYHGGRLRFEDTIHRFQNHVICKINSGERVQKQRLAAWRHYATGPESLKRRCICN
jgi:hypothetical protein